MTGNATVVDGCVGVVNNLVDYREVRNVREADDWVKFTHR